MLRSRRAATALLALACGAAMAVPLWVGRFLPMLDLPQHLALTAVLLGDGGAPLARYYEPQPFELTPYWVHYVLLAGLGRVVSVEDAARLVLTAYAITLPWAAMELAGALGAPRRAGLMAAPLALNTNFYYGFLAYCIGVVLLLLAMALVIRQAARPRSGRALLLGLLGAVLFFTHAQVLAFLGLAGLVVAACAARGVRGRAAVLAPLVPAGLLLVLWVHQVTRPDRPDRYFASLDDPRPRYQPLLERVRQVPDTVAGAYQDRSDRALLLGWTLALAALAWRGRALRPRGVVPAALPLLALACTLALPEAIQGQWNIGPRFAWVAALLLTPFASAPRAAAAAALALSLAAGSNAVRLHRAFDEEVGGFDAALQAIPPGSRVLPLVFGHGGGHFRSWPYLHFGQYAVVRRASFVAHSFAANGPLPVRIRPEARVPVQGVWRPDQFVFEQHAPFFDAFLVRDPAGTRDPLRGRSGLVLAASAPPWRVYLRDHARH